LIARATLRVCDEIDSTDSEMFPLRAATASHAKATNGGGPREAYYGDYSAGHALAFGIDYAL